MLLNKKKRIVYVCVDIDHKTEEIFLTKEKAKEYKKNHPSRLFIEQWNII